MKMAKANPEEVDKLREFFQAIEEMLDDPDKDNWDIGDWVRDNFPEWERTVYGYTVMFENACDPATSSLEFKPEILAAIKSLGLVRAIVEYRDRAGALNFQLEKMDDFINQLREVCMVEATQ